MSATKKAKTNNNVFSIADNPKYEKKRFVMLDKSENADDLVTYTITRGVFGLVSGDVIIAKKNFKPGDIKPNTIVVADTGDGVTLTSNVSDPDDVYAVVTGFQRNFES
jgi:hypothetical protein